VSRPSDIYSCNEVRIALKPAFASSACSDQRTRKFLGGFGQSFVLSVVHKTCELGAHAGICFAGFPFLDGASPLLWRGNTNLHDWRYRECVARQSGWRLEYLQHQAHVTTCMSNPQPTPDRLPKNGTGAPWGRVYGELLTFDDPETRLPAIDRLEGFHPGGRCLYRRVLTSAQVHGIVLPAWLYVGEDLSGRLTPLGGSRWPRKP